MGGGLCIGMDVDSSGEVLTNVQGLDLNGVLASSNSEEGDVQGSNRVELDGIRSRKTRYVGN